MRRPIIFAPTYREAAHVAQSLGCDTLHDWVFGNRAVYAGRTPAGYDVVVYRRMGLDSTAITALMAYRRAGFMPRTFLESELV